MQLFPCPFCGLRGENEFHFAGDAGNLRPDGPDTSAEAWSSYLHLRHNAKGRASEIWMHVPCGEMFRLDRDTVTHAVEESAALTAEAHR